jgi:hypothetical protein
MRRGSADEDAAEEDAERAFRSVPGRTGSRIGRGASSAWGAQPPSRTCSPWR